MTKPALKRGRFLRIQDLPAPERIVAPPLIPPELRKFCGRTEVSRQRVLRWIQQGGKCYYCRCDTILLEPVARRKEPLPGNAATLEHLRSRWHPDRREKPKPGEIRHVMACNRCNAERARDEQAARPLELLHRDGGRDPDPGRTA